MVALVAAAGTMGASSASAAPRTAGAGAFHDSVGLVANDTYFDTPYVHWSTALDKARELGVRHLRLGVFSSDNAGWDARHAEDLQTAAAAGFGLDLVVSRMCAPDGTMPRCLARARSLPAGSVEGFEWPHEYDNRGDAQLGRAPARSGATSWPSACAPTRLFAGVPIIGPSLRFVGSPLLLGDQSGALDRANIHPYTGGKSPTPSLVRAEIARLRPVTGDKPVVATDAGFHTALGAAAPAQPGVDERTAAIYTLRTVLEHFGDGVQRTYLRELVDEANDLNDERVSYGLMHTDFSPKPAYTALQRLLALRGPGQPAGRPRARPRRDRRRPRRARARPRPRRRDRPGRALAHGQHLGPAREAGARGHARHGARDDPRGARRHRRRPGHRHGPVPRDDHRRHGRPRRSPPTRSS